MRDIIVEAINDGNLSITVNGEVLGLTKENTLPSFGEYHKAYSEEHNNDRVIYHINKNIAAYGRYHKGAFLSVFCARDKLDIELA